jgi:fucose permease
MTAIAAPRIESARATPLLVLSYACFIALGMVSGLLGAAWPTLYPEFGLALGDAGVAIGMMTVGYLGASFLSGASIQRLGYGALFAIGGVLTAVGVGLYVVAPGWGVYLVGALIAGVGTGMYDAGLNNYVAAFYSTRAMNWLHAAFGIGITISPFIVTRLIADGASWRAGYAVVLVVCTVLALVLVFVRGLWRSAAPAAPAAGDFDTVKKAAQARLGQSLRVPVVWLCIALTFFVAGMEATPGQWASTLFAGREVEAESAGLLISLYWGSFTVGRILFGAIMPWLIARLGTVTNVLRLVIGLSIAAAFVLWWNPAQWASFAALTVFGFAQAPLFPVAVSATRGYVGQAHAENTIGFQLAGASGGIALLPGLAGVFMQNISTEMMAPFCFAAAIALYAVHEALVRVGGHAGAGRNAAV